jgi:DNA-binding MarR family transcriptional regulator
VSRLVARLERRRFLRRRPGARDSRFVEAWITRRGDAAYRKMPLAVEEYRRAVAGFDAEQTQWLRRAAIQMIENIGVELLPERPPQQNVPTARAFSTFCESMGFPMSRE